MQGGIKCLKKSDDCRSDTLFGGDLQADLATFHEYGMLVLQPFPVL
jgi:hypothetical protein